MSNTNIILEQNGRLFPVWVMHNFKKYLLPEIIRKDGDDPCNDKIIEGLTLYQSFVGQFLNYQSPFKDLLIYHGVGSGKTNTAINIYNILFNYTPKWNIFLLIPASLHDEPWLKDIKRWMAKEDYEKRFANIIFIHYDSPYADKDFLDKVRKADSNKTSIFIIDEVHKFITNVYNNVSSKNGKRAQIIYEYIQQEKKENSNTRIILLSATPVSRIPFEFALIFNLLRPGIFPDSESKFQELFISSTNFTSLNENTKNLFQRRIIGLVSYYIGSTPDKYASKIVHYVNIVMNKYQEEIYNYFEQIEEQKEKLRIKMMRGKIGDTTSTYLTYTRQACNFVFPNISNKINGETRPRPSHYHIKESDAVMMDDTVKKDKKLELTKSKAEYIEYNKAINLFINSFLEYLKNILRKDKENNYTLNNDIQTFNTKYNNSFSNFYEKEKKKSNLFETLYKHSPKFIRVIFNIYKTKGTVMVYSNYVTMEGLQLFKIYLNFFGFVSIDNDNEFNKKQLDDKKLSKDNLRWCEFHGNIDRETRRINKEIFNMTENKYGKYCKIIMISPAGAEGISLNNVRQVHIIDPSWTETKIEQIIGRALRYCHHKDLPLEERKVDIFRYKMIRSNKKITTDEKMEDNARKKNNILLSFIEAVKEAAVDCELFKAHNMMGSKYKCFQFNQESLFETPINQAYQSKIEYDLKLDNGSNAKDSDRVKIKVKEITAVTKIDESSVSMEDKYWFDELTGIVYNYELNYPMGKVSKDESGHFLILENDVYIIDTIINIPELKIYN